MGGGRLSVEGTLDSPGLSLHQRDRPVPVALESLEPTSLNSDVFSSLVIAGENNEAHNK